MLGAGLAAPVLGRAGLPLADPAFVLASAAASLAWSAGCGRGSVLTRERGEARLVADAGLWGRGMCVGKRHVYGICMYDSHQGRDVCGFERYHLIKSEIV